MASPPNYVAHKPHFHREQAWKAPVRLATTTAGTLATSFESGDTIDGETLAAGDRLLIKNQSADEENGIYVVAASGAPVRAYDMDVGTEVPGAVVLVLDGDDNAGTFWIVTNTTAPVLDTDGITWTPLTTDATTTNRQIVAVIDGGGSEIADTPAPEVDIVMRENGTITAWTIVADAVGDAEFDVWLTTYAAFPAEVADSIVDGNYPALSSQQKNEDTDLSDWSDVTFGDGDIVHVRLNSSAGLTRVVLSLKYTRT